MTTRTDQLDERILEILKLDGRTSFREIGRQLDAPESSVRQRVRRLQRANAIRIGAVVDLSRTGHSIIGYIRIATNPALHTKVVERLCALEETTYVATVSGSFNVLVVLWARDIADLVRTVDDHVSSIRGVNEVDVRIGGRTMKHNFHEIAIQPS